MQILVTARAKDRLAEPREPEDKKHSADDDAQGIERNVVGEGYANRPNEDG
jgi:hypothetical protein